MRLSLCAALVLTAGVRAETAEDLPAILGEPFRVDVLPYTGNWGIFRGSMTADRRTLYYDFWDEGRGSIWRAVRDDPGEPFRDAAPLEGPVGASGLLQSVTFPAVSPDGSRLYFSRWVGTSGAEIWFAERSEPDDPDSPFDLVHRLPSPVNVGSNSWSLMGDVVRDEDGREIEILFTRDHFKLWRARFVEPGNPLAGFEDARQLVELYPDGYDGYDFPPGVSPAGHRILWSDRSLNAADNIGPRPGGSGCTDLWTAYRPDLDSPFGDPVNLGSPPNTAPQGAVPASCLDWGDELCPWVSPDGELLLFGRQRSGLWQVEIDLCPDIGSCPTTAIFRRGDVDGNGVLDITDPINNLSYQFLSEFEPLCLDAHDFNDDGVVDISDTIANLEYQFLGKAPPPAPGEASCGVDPTGEIENDLGCESYPVWICGE